MATTATSSCSNRFGLWAWVTTPAPLQYVSVIAAPVAVAVLWGAFATPDDASRSGKTVIATPGLLLLGAALVVYHLLSWDRVLWLLRH
ncbi:DUF2568 domain-containing protein [Streptomyces pseudovenezuelae]|uniref:DUF2568 domain-containing protein n=1 Tax=Streptomyces pseudovenezuelae TaxID=67350 RepID=UPI0037FAF64A